MTPPIVVSLIRTGTGGGGGRQGKGERNKDISSTFHLFSPSTGGRDRRGAPIITMYATEHADLRPSNVGKVLSYLSKVPE